MSTIAPSSTVAVKPRPVGLIVAAVGAVVAIAAVVLVIALSGTSSTHASASSTHATASQASAPSVPLMQYYGTGAPPQSATGSHPSGHARGAFLRAEHSYGMVP